MNSKKIGNNYERIIARKLSLWLTYNQSDDVVWRDIGSGNKATIRKKQNKESIWQGDIVPIDLQYKYFFDVFAIDTKSYKEINWLFINNNNNKSNVILQQWVKVVNDTTEKIPLMIVQIRDRKTPETIFMPTYIKLNDVLYNHNFMVYFFEQNPVYNCKIFILDDFLNHITPEEFVELNVLKNF